MPNINNIVNDRDFSFLDKALRAQIDLATKSGQALVEEHRERIAYGLMSVGIHLIPSDHLTDQQFVVSRGVYEAAKRLCEDKG
jgi:hypothetical protein